MHPQYVGWSSDDVKLTNKEDFRKLIPHMKKKLEQYTVFGELFPYSVNVYEDVAVVFGLIDRTFEKADRTGCACQASIGQATERVDLATKVTCPLSLGTKRSQKPFCS